MEKKIIAEEGVAAIRGVNFEGQIQLDANTLRLDVT